MFENYGLRFEGRYQFDFVNVKVNYLVRSMFTMQMEDMFREQLWRKQDRPRELYPDESSKDAPSFLNSLSLTVTVVVRPTCFNRDIWTQRLVASTHAVVLI